MSIWSSPVERRYSKTPLFLSYTKSITTGNEKKTPDIDRRATDRKGKLLVRSIGEGVATSDGIIVGMIVIRFDKTIP